MTLTCSLVQRDIIKTHHEWPCAHNGVDKTVALMTQQQPEVTSARQLRHDVREYVQSCVASQKIGVCQKSIRATQFVLLTQQPMRIALDTIGPMDISKEFKYIIVIIATFTRYVALFPRQRRTRYDHTSAVSERPTKLSQIRDPNS